MGIGAIQTEGDLRGFVQQQLGQLPELVRQLQGAVAGWRPDWQTPSFAAGWTHWDPVNYPVGFVRDPHGRVQLRGLIQKTAAPVAFESMLTLPEGYRPGANTVHPGFYNDAACGVTVLPGGSVVIRAVPSPVAGGWQSLDGVSFWAEG